jgi:FAD-dependent urate hydroxylase
MPSRSAVVIIGAGPYGLSIAAHLRPKDVRHRIVGDPMQVWLGHTPDGMLLKSDGFASTLYDPKAEFTLRRYCEPLSPIGPGWRSRFFTDLPVIFRSFPKSAQYRLTKGFLGPAGGWFLRGRYGRVPFLAGYQIKGAKASGDRAILRLKSENGDERRIETEHVIAATGYRPDIRRLPFLSTDMKSQLKLSNNVPELSTHFESSVPGPFFVGPAAIDSFGPVLRFACGAKFAASRLSNHLARGSPLTKRHTTAAAREQARSASQ